MTSARSASSIFSRRSAFGAVETVERDARHLRHGLGDDVAVDLAAALHRRLLLAPLLLDGLLLLRELVGLVAQVRGALEVLVGDGLFLLLVQTRDLAVHVLEVRRLRHRADADARARLVDHVDRLVREEAAVDVTARQLDGLLESFVGVDDAVVRLVLVAQTLEDLDRLLLARRLDHHGLEATLERAVLLDVLAVLVERRRADALHLAARQRRLEHVARVDRAFRATGSDQRVQLVDEQDHVLGAAHLGHDRLDALFELAAVLGAGDHHRQVEHDQALAAQDLGDVAAHDLLRETLDDRGLADARLAEQHRVVLGAAAEDLDDALDLVLTADHRVELALAGEVGEVTAEAVEGRGLALRVAARRSSRADRFAFVAVFAVAVARAEELEDLLADVVELDAEVHQHLRRDPLVLPDQAEQEVLGADVVVAELARLLHRQFEHLLGAGGERELPHRHHRGSGLDDLLDLVPDLLQVDVHVLQHVRSHPGSLLDEAEEDVLGADVLVIELLCFLSREAHDLLRAVGESVEHACRVLSGPAVGEALPVFRPVGRSV
jgi:hypothetical protein